MLRKEFEIGYSLDNHNICNTYSIKSFETLGNAIFLEYIDGRTLDKYIEEGNHTDDELRYITLQLCHALEYAHKKQIIHRDIKPQNIIITYNGDNVKLIDFGLSDTDYHSGLKIPAGTLNYASPEQIRGEELDNRSDIYSLGVIINYIFKERSNRKIKKIVTRCCEQDRDKRYNNCSEIRAALTKRNWSKTILIISAILLITSVNIIILNKNSNPTLSDTVISNDDIKRTPEEESIFQARMIEKNLEYVRLLSEKTNSIKINIYEIPDFKSDSIAFPKRASFLLDSIFATSEERKSEIYLTLKKDTNNPSFYNMYHYAYIYSFFNEAREIFYNTEDSHIDSLTKSASGTIIRRPENYKSLPRDEQLAINTMIKNSEYDYRTATITKYIIKLREDKGLPPLTAEFLNYYENQKK